MLNKTQWSFETSVSICQSTRRNSPQYLKLHQSIRRKSPEHLNRYQSPKFSSSYYLNLLQYWVFEFLERHGNPGPREDKRWRSPSSSTNNLIYRPQKEQNLLRSSVSFKNNVPEHSYKTCTCSIKLFFFFAIKKEFQFIGRYTYCNICAIDRPRFLLNTDEGFALWKNPNICCLFNDVVSKSDHTESNYPIMNNEKKKSVSW